MFTRATKRQLHRILRCDSIRRGMVALENGYHCLSSDSVVIGEAFLLFFLSDLHETENAKEAAKTKQADPDSRVVPSIFDTRPLQY